MKQLASMALQAAMVLPLLSCVPQGSLRHGGEALIVQELDAYGRRAKTHRATLKTYCRRDMTALLDRLSVAQSQQLQSREADLIAAQSAAIDLYEKRAPAHGAATVAPLILFRLAELYYRREADRYFVSTERYEKQLEEFELGSTLSPPSDEPELQLDETISTLRRLVNQSKTWPRRDAALYLLGYSLNEQGSNEEGLTAWLELVCGNHISYRELSKNPQSSTGALPPSELDALLTQAELSAIDAGPYGDCRPLEASNALLPEVWFRIGEYHFDYDTSERGLDRAIAAYQKSLSHPRWRYEAVSRYKIGWSFYRSDRFQEALGAFLELLASSGATDDPEAARVSTDLRPEALQYTAIIFAEDDWDFDMVPDGVSARERLLDGELLPQEHPDADDIVSMTGDVLFDLARYDDAIEVWQLLSDRWAADDSRREALESRIDRAQERMTPSRRPRSPRSLVTSPAPETVGDAFLRLARERLHASAAAGPDLVFTDFVQRSASSYQDDALGARRQLASIGARRAEIAVLFAPESSTSQWSCPATGIAGPSEPPRSGSSESVRNNDDVLEEAWNRVECHRRAFEDLLRAFTRQRMVLEAELNSEEPGSTSPTKGWPSAILLRRDLAN